jgi:hypothetical protein
MRAQALRTAHSAWEYLVQKGGLEVAGRDQPLVEMLKSRLDPQAGSIDEALNGISVEALVNAFFGSVTPFVAMMQDLLDYFVAAAAREGPEQWTLALGEGADRLDANFDHFRQWIERGSTTTNERRHVPIMDYSQLWDMRRHFFLLDSPEENAENMSWQPQPTPSHMTGDLVEWLRAYENGTYRPLPQVIADVYQRGGVIADVAALVIEVYQAVLAVAPTRAVLEERGRYNASSSDDFWSVSNLRNFESDFWVRGRVLDLASWLEAPPERQRAVTDSLQKQLGALPRRTARLNITISDIEEILSLPIWNRRYELYSAWVLTSILHALRAHSISLHDDHGVISFAFRETLMASVLSSQPPARILSEKRIPAGHLSGHSGRVASVQPDYSLWTEMERCPLVVECKHYRKSSTRNFADALNDYSAALPDAVVILVNYGPVSPRVQQAISATSESRCYAVGTMHPEEPKSRAVFEGLVLRVVGEPVPEVVGDRGLLGSLGMQPALLIDVSGSMGAVLLNEETTPFIEALVRRHGIKAIVAADDRLLMEAGVSRADITSAITASGTGATSLGRPAQELLERFTSVVVLTDRDGAQDIERLPRARVQALWVREAEVVIVTLTSGD